MRFLWSTVAAVRRATLPHTHSSGLVRGLPRRVGRIALARKAPGAAVLLGPGVRSRLNARV